jgi:hypothetical protein
MGPVFLLIFVNYVIFAHLSYEIFHSPKIQ